MFIALFIVMFVTIVHSVVLSAITTKTKETCLTQFTICPKCHQQHIPQTSSIRRNLRHAIYYQFVYVLDSPPKRHWKGRMGSIALIRTALHLPPNQQRVIRCMLDKVMRGMEEGEDFDGEIQNENKKGRKIIIVPGSVEENLIATWMEAHCGFQFTNKQINEHRRQQGLEGFSRYCVMAAFYRLQPKINVLQKMCLVVTTKNGSRQDGMLHNRCR